MMRRIAAATVFPITLAEAKDHCRVDGSDHDTLIQSLIAVANEMVGEMSGLVLGQETWELAVTDPSGPVVLPIPPFHSLLSINGAAPAGFTVTRDMDCATVSGPWPAGDVSIMFVAGGDTPPGLRHAMLMMVALWFEQREAASEAEMRPVPLAAQSLINLHRRGWVAA